MLTMITHDHWLLLSAKSAVVNDYFHCEPHITDDEANDGNGSY